jgi:hypothetical protein
MNFVGRLVVFGAVALVGCSFYMPADKLRPRASFDLHCPETQLTMTELGGDCGKKVAEEYNCTLGVNGCGQQVTYVHVPNGAWVMNNALKQ